MKHVRNIIAITIGTMIMGFGIHYFNIANGLAEGGVTGITLLLKYVFNINPGISNLLINIPLFLIGWKILGRISFIYTVYGTIALSVFLYLFQGIGLNLTEDMILASLYAGVTLGIGLGIVFRYGGTTGGVDIIARLAYKTWGISMGKTMLITDILVILASLYYLDLKRAMYTLVAIFIGTRVIDFVQQGSYAAKAAMIISDHAYDITQRINKEMGRGVTLLKGQGSYTGHEKEIMYCVVNRRQIIKLKNLVHAVDPYAFVTVNDVHEVLGEGFTHDEKKRPLREV